MPSTILARGEIWQPHRARKRPDSADPTVVCTPCSEPAEIRVIVCGAPLTWMADSRALFDVVWPVFGLPQTLPGSYFALIVVSRSYLRPQ
jgi:hypothetical protein